MNSLLFARHDLFRIIIPLIIEQTLAVTIGMADSVMVSSAGEAAISGVSLVDTINILIIYIFSALAAGGAVVISQFLGKGDKMAANKSAKQLVWVCFISSFSLMLITLVFRKSILKLVFGSISEDVMANALVYFLFTALSYPFLGVYNGGAAIFRAIGNSKISMFASIIMNVINVVGNAILIFGFHMGAMGAAIATLVSRIVGATLMIVLLYNKTNAVYLENILNFKPDFKIIKQICAIGIPNSLENGMFQFGKVLTQSIIATFGTVQIAANAVANSLATFQYTPGVAVGLSMITIVGQCVGAGEKEQAKKYVKTLLGIAYAMIIIVSLLLCIFADQIISLFSLSAESAKIAKDLLYVHSVVVSLVHPSAFAITNSFRASSDVKYPMVMSIISMWVFRVGFSYILGKHMGFGVMGVWYAMFMDWIFRAILYITRFLRGTWLTKYKPLEIN